MHPLLLIAAVQAAAPAAGSQALRSAVARVPAGAPVQVELGNRRIIAPIVATMSDGFALRDTAGGSQPVRYADVTRFWVRRRAIGAGAAVGGAVGAAFGAFAGLLAAGLCESGDCPTEGQGLLGGGLIGALMGAGAGAIIGAAIPRWDLAWANPSRGRGSSRANTTVALPPAGASSETERRRIGEFTASAMTGFGGFPPDTLIPGKGVTAGVLAALGFRRGRFAFGPEAGLLFGEQKSWSLSGVARWDLRETRARSLVPYVVAGLGGVFWRLDTMEADLLTGTVGLGVTTGARGRLEVRWHPNLQNGGAYSVTGQPIEPTLVTVAAGYRFVW